MFQRKFCIRIFVLLIAGLVVIDVCPSPNWFSVIKRPAGKLLSAIELRQGEWVMFTPNPVINNRWMSAEMKTKDGRTLNWDSTLWSRASSWDKFVGFRHVNYFNRCFQTWCMAGSHDFLHYVARHCGEDLKSIHLHLNRMDLIMPDDGTLPPREEAQWRLISEPWISEEL